MNRRSPTALALGVLTTPCAIWYNMRHQNELERNMHTYTVYTDTGTYTGIRAVSAEHAKKIVWKQTLGRERIESMSAHIE